MDAPAGFLRSVNPCTLKMLGQTRVSSKQEILQAVSDSRQAFAAWSQRSLSARLGLIESFRQQLFLKRHEVAELISQETGKPIIESLIAEVFSVLESAAWLKGNAAKLLQAEPVQLNKLFFLGKKSYNVFEPLGTIAVISPWNFPFSIPAASILSALAAGNSVLLKPSPLTPLVANKIVELAQQAGMPANLVQVLHGDRDEAKALVQADVDRVIFTGSVAGGKAIMSLAAEKLHPVSLELGGKHPALVLEDADIDRSVEAIVWSAFTNCGQACASIERLYVVQSRHDELVEKLTARIKQLRIGDPLDSATDVGPMINEQQFGRVRGLIAEALSAGAKLLAGNRTLAEIDQAKAARLPGYFLEPTLLTNVRQEMRIAREEIFGPVLPVIPVPDRESAIAAANDSNYGLGASIWSADLRQASLAAGQIKAGMVWVNDSIYSHACPQTPWGGIKSSGFGRSHGKYGLLDFVNIKHIGVDKPGKRDWNYPYSYRQVQVVDAGLELLHGPGGCQRLKAVGRLAYRWLAQRLAAKFGTAKAEGAQGELGK